LEDKVKRLFDIVFSFLAILITLPLMVVVALLIKLTDKGPVLFKQKRPGLDGKDFYLYKFRTMYVNNDQILREYLDKNPEAREQWKKYRKLKGYDPRVTPIGRFLRKYSLDELPQFFNVLKGDMSVVGPRPYLWEEFEEYKVPKNIVQKLLSVKPGITGLWQIEARNEATFEERIKMDLKYIKERSFWLDLKIVLKTIKAMLTGKGAY
jgi:undecaprenyl-phosphate galactose phosphotransferase